MFSHREVISKVTNWTDWALFETSWRKPESAMVLSRGFIAFVLAIATTIAAPTQDTVVPETSLTELKESPPLPGAFSAKVHSAANMRG